MFLKRRSSTLARGYSLAVASAIILATTAIFIRYLTQTYPLPPLVLAFWRDGFTAITLLLLLSLFWPRLLRVKRNNLFYLITFGVVLALFNSTWTFSVTLNGAALATILVFCSAGFTALLGWWLLKERMGWVKLLAVALSLLGCVLVANVAVSSTRPINAMGILTGGLSGFCYALYSLMGRSSSVRGLNPWTTLVYTFGVAAFFLLLANLLPGFMIPGTATHAAEIFILGDAWAGWLILFALAAGPTLLGFGLYNSSLVYLPSSIANLIVTLEPIFTTVIAYLLLGEELSLMQVFGGLVIITGVVILRIWEGKNLRSNYSPKSQETG